MAANSGQVRVGAIELTGSLLSYRSKQEMGQHQLPIVNTTALQQHRLRIEFAFTRSTISMARVTEPGGGPIATMAHLPGRGLVYLEFATPVATGSAINFFVDYTSGEPPRVARYQWGRPTLEEFPASRLQPIASLDFRDLLADFDFFPISRMWDKFLADEVRPTHRRFKAFFRALDLATNTSLEFASPVSGATKTVTRDFLGDAMRRLDDHLSIRLQSVAASCFTQLADLPGEAEPITVRMLSELMLPVYKVFFTNNGRLDQAQIAEAFCRFANGELRTGENLDQNPWNCEPDSAQEFHFANHALWSVRAGVDADDWGLILPCCAASQEYYIQAYRPGGSRPYLMRRYAPWNYRTETRPLTIKTINAAVARYRALSKDELSRQLDANLMTMLTGSRTAWKRLRRRETAAGG